MVTKLKKYSRHTVCKLIAYLLIVLLCWLAFTTLAASYFNIHRLEQQNRELAWYGQIRSGDIHIIWDEPEQVDWEQVLDSGLSWAEEQTIRRFVRRELENLRFMYAFDDVTIEEQWQISSGYIRAALPRYLGRELTWPEEHALPRIAHEELAWTEEQTIRAIVRREFAHPRPTVIPDPIINEQIRAGYVRAAWERYLGRGLTWQEEQVLSRLVREELTQLRPIYIPAEDTMWQGFASWEEVPRITIDAPVTIDGRTMLSVREIAEIFGFEVYLDTVNQEIIIGQDYPLVFADNTMLTIREVAEIFGLEIHWDAHTNEIIAWRFLPPNAVAGQASPAQLIISHTSPPGFTVHENFPHPELILPNDRANPEEIFILGLQEVSVYFLLMLPLIILLAFTTGRRPEDDELHQGYLDRIYSDILLAALVAIIVVGGWIWITMVAFFVSSGIALESAASGIWFAGLVGCLTGLLALIVGNALIRKVKAHNLLRHSLACTVMFLLVRLARRVWQVIISIWQLVFSGPDNADQPLASRLFKRQRRFIIMGFVLGILICFFAVLGAYLISLFFIACLLALVYYFLFNNKADFAQLQEGLDASLAERLKSEQLKVDLITNVSHDLKTPLTSIISYVELLSKEKKLSPAAKDYVKILQQKSDRLNHIVADLFDLAKSTSGNITMEIETLDLKRLFEQTLADLEDRIAESGMEIRSRLPEEPLMIRGDGKKLYRVLQNLLDNALKYSLAGSRIYVEMREHEDKAQVIIKNTACYEMDFNAEDVLQRFNRGDKARSSEGSGLGLAIAQSFIHNCGGDFDVAVDGDQFKVIVEFPLAHS